ncbi:hypothetical protein [Chryseobacterium salivictor]|nr:hypothetical protein [Chryseobacterium salivictor]
MFFTKIFKFPQPRNDENANQQKPKEKLDSKIRWDAETVDYEEVKEPKQK